MEIPLASAITRRRGSPAPQLSEVPAGDREGGTDRMRPQRLDADAGGMVPVDSHLGRPADARASGSRLDERVPAAGDAQIHRWMMELARKSLSVLERRVGSRVSRNRPERRVVREIEARPLVGRVLQRLSYMSERFRRGGWRLQSSGARLAEIVGGRFERGGPNCGSILPISGSGTTC